MSGAVSWLFLGKGESNSSIASFLPGQKFALSESDSQLEEFVWESGNWKKVSWVQGNLEQVDWSRFKDFKIIVSPGIDPRRNFFKHVKGQEVRELDLFCQYFKKPTLVITGTLGKSTFTTRLGEILRREMGGEAKVFVGGNLNPSAFRLFETHPHAELAVLEVSSFMAERLRSARFRWGVLLNLFPNHLDRYDSLENYYAEKIELMNRCDVSFRPETNPESQLELLRNVAKFILGCEPKLSSFENLPSLPHRQELWVSPNKVCFVNDSKSTTVQSTLAALQEFGSRFSKICLILGGKDKGDDFSRLISALRAHDRVGIYGKSQAQIFKMLETWPGPKVCELIFDDLVKRLILNQSSEELILLSPGATSLDQFKNFEERGKRFWTLVGKTHTID